jgi:predicted RNase H-like nuclease (RuvC/YqgF family)
LPLTRLGSLILLLTWLCLGAGHALAAPEGKAKPDAPREADKRQVVSDILAAKEDPAATIRLIETRIKELEGASDAETAKRLTELYRKALSNLEVMRNQEAKAAALAQTLENAPTEIQRLRKEIEVLQAQAEDKPRGPQRTISRSRNSNSNSPRRAADEAALTARLGRVGQKPLGLAPRPGRGPPGHAGYPQGPG